MKVKIADYADSQILNETRRLESILTDLAKKWEAACEKVDGLRMHVTALTEKADIVSRRRKDLLSRPGFDLSSREGTKNLSKFREKEMELSLSIGDYEVAIGIALKDRDRFGLDIIRTEKKLAGTWRQLWAGIAENAKRQVSGSLGTDLSVAWYAENRLRAVVFKSWIAYLLNGVQNTRELKFDIDTHPMTVSTLDHKERLRLEQENQRARKQAERLSLSPAVVPNDQAFEKKAHPPRLSPPKMVPLDDSRLTGVAPLTAGKVYEHTR